MKKIIAILFIILLAAYAHAQRYAHVSNELVNFVATTDSPGSRYGQGVLKNLYPCPLDVVKGWHYDGSTWSGPTAEEIAAQAAKEAKEERLDAILDELDAMHDSFDKLLDVLESKQMDSVSTVLSADDVDLIKSAGGQ